MDNLQTQIDNLKTLQESYSEVAQAAEAYNVGKTELAANITAKGVPASASETLPELAEKVSAIAQESYTIDGGEMYAKQLFGSLEIPNYWNLYDVLAQLLSDGRLVSYGGILLAEYYKGYDSLALSGAGSGGAYVVSDKDPQGKFIMYTNDTTHVWDTAFDGKGNRWVAYCFAYAGHDFTIADTNTCPRSIHIGRHVGTIKSLVNGRVSEIVVTDGNMLDAFYNAGAFTQNFGKRLVLKTTGTTTNYVIYNSTNIETLYFECGKISIPVFSTHLVGECSNLNFAIVKAGELGIPTGEVFYNCSALKNLVLECPLITTTPVITTAGMENVYLRLEEINANGILYVRGGGNTVKYIYVGYFTNDKTKQIKFTSYGALQNNVPTDLELQDGWCKPLDVSIFTYLTAENIVNHILNRLGDNTGQSPLTITLGATNLAKLTAEEIAIATNKGFTLA